MFMQSTGWKDEVLPAIASRGVILTRELIEKDGTPGREAAIKGELRALKWVAELPAFIEKSVGTQMRDIEGAPPELEAQGHPYGPTPDGGVPDSRAQ